MQEQYYDLFQETRFLQHYGVSGQHWGVRKYQNPDGSLTDLGKARLKKQAGGVKTILRDDNTRNEVSVSADSRNQVNTSISQKLSDASTATVSQVGASSKTVTSGKEAVDSALSSPSNITAKKFSITREMIQKALSEKRSAESKKAAASTKKTETKSEETKTEDAKKTTKKTSTKKKTTSKASVKKATLNKTSSKKSTGKKKVSTKSLASKYSEKTNNKSITSKGSSTITRDLDMASRSASRKAADNFLKRYQIKR